MLICDWLCCVEWRPGSSSGLSLLSGSVLRPAPSSGSAPTEHFLGRYKQRGHAPNTSLTPNQWWHFKCEDGLTVTEQNEWMVNQTRPSIYSIHYCERVLPSPASYAPTYVCPPPRPVSSRVTNMSGHHWREMMTHTNSRANRFNLLINPPPRWTNPMTGFVHDNLMTLLMVF